MSDLFNIDDHLTDSAMAEKKFTDAYKCMSREIHRVSYEKVTIMQRLLAWIYGIIHRDPNHTKDKQKNIEKEESAKAFMEVKRIFQPEPSNSMCNADILAHTKRNFKHGSYR